MEDLIDRPVHGSHMKELEDENIIEALKELDNVLDIFQVSFRFLHNQCQ